MIAFALITTAPPLGATTWTVRPHPGSGAPIQAAIEAAAPGDSILVLPGTYSENVDFKGKPLHLMTSGGAQRTFLEPTVSSVATATLHDIEGTSSITGFTIRDGLVGVSIWGAEVLIQDNVITNNTEGGLSCFPSLSRIPSRVTIRSNIFESNQARTVGGAVVLWSPASATVDANIFRNNSCTSGDGGAVYALATYGSMILIRGNTVTDNHAGDHGGGLYLSGQGLDSDHWFQVEHNLIADNQADGFEHTGGSGGGIWVGSARGSISMNTIVRNNAPGSLDFLGGNVAVTGPRDLSITRNIIALAPRGRGLYCDQTTSLTLANNLFWENAGGPTSSACVDLIGLNGNLQADPRFCDPQSSNFALDATSPAFGSAAGYIGAYAEPGCNTPTRVLTWGRLKWTFSQVGTRPIRRAGDQ